MAKEHEFYRIAGKSAIVKRVVVCPDCGTPYTVYRKAKRKRSLAEGHVKDLWCFVCKAEKKYVQLSSDDAKYHY